MKIINRWTTGLFTAIVLTAGSLGLSSLAGGGDEEPTVTTIGTTGETTESIATTVVTTQPREKITFEYYTITEEAVKNGWTCGTIDRCDSYDKNAIRVYIYDPSIVGKHQFNIIFGVSVRQFELTIVCVDEYNNVLDIGVFTLDNNGEDNSLSSSRVFFIEFDEFPPGTKYVKFADITNIVHVNKES